MLTFDISITGTEAFLARLTRLEQLTGLEDVLNDEADLLVADEQIYPPELPGQRYIRTGHLRDMTYHNPARRTGGGVEVQVVSGAEYAEQVVGENQAPAFAGRWRKFKKVAEDRMPRIRASVQAAVYRLWGR
jgi:hypothetical protein